MPRNSGGRKAGAGSASALNFAANLEAQREEQQNAKVKKLQTQMTKANLNIANLRPAQGAGTQINDNGTAQTLNWVDSGRMNKCVHTFGNGNNKIVTIASPSGNDMGKKISVVFTEALTGTHAGTLTFTASGATFDTASRIVINTNTGTVSAITFNSDDDHNTITFTNGTDNTNNLFSRGTEIVFEVISPVKIRALVNVRPEGDGSANGATIAFS